MNKKVLFAVILVGGLAMFSVPFAAVGLRHYGWEPFVTTSESMMPTIFPGDRFYVRKSFEPSEITRGTLVAYRNPQDPSVIFVKRVVAVAGDTISIANNMLFINSKQVMQKASDGHLASEFAEDFPSHKMLREELGETQYSILVHDEMVAESDFNNTYLVPSGTVFVLGDYRTNSFDSRNHGAVEISEITGIPSLIFYSASKDGNIRWDRMATKLYQ